MTLQLLAVLPFPQLLLGDDAEKLLVTGVRDAEGWHADSVVACVPACLLHPRLKYAGHSADATALLTVYSTSKQRSFTLSAPKHSVTKWSPALRSSTKAAKTAGASLAGLAATVWSDAWLTTHGLPLWQHQYCRYSAATGVQHVVNQTSYVKAVLTAQCSIYPDVVLLAVQQRKTATQRSGSAASPPLRWIRAGLQLPSDVSLLPTSGSDSTVPIVASKGQRMPLVTEPCLLPGSSSCRPVATPSTETAETKLLLELHPHDGRSALAMVTASGQQCLVILSPSLDILGHSTLPLQLADGADDIATISGLAWLPAGGLALIDSAGILTVLDAQSYRPCMLHVSLKGEATGNPCTPGCGIPFRLLAELESQGHRDVQALPDCAKPVYSLCCCLEAAQDKPVSPSKGIDSISLVPRPNLHHEPAPVQQERLSTSSAPHEPQSGCPSSCCPAPTWLLALSNGAVVVMLRLIARGPAQQPQLGRQHQLRTLTVHTATTPKTWDAQPPSPSPCSTPPVHRHADIAHQAASPASQRQLRQHAPPCHVSAGGAAPDVPPLAQSFPAAARSMSGALYSPGTEEPGGCGLTRPGEDMHLGAGAAGGGCGGARASCLSGHPGGGGGGGESRARSCESCVSSLTSSMLLAMPPMPLGSLLLAHGYTAGQAWKQPQATAGSSWAVTWVNLCEAPASPPPDTAPLQATLSQRSSHSRQLTCGAAAASTTLRFARSSASQGGVGGSVGGAGYSPAAKPRSSLMLPSSRSPVNTRHSSHSFHTTLTPSQEAKIASNLRLSCSPSACPRSQPGHQRTSSALHPLPAIRTHTGSYAAAQAHFSSTDSHAAASAWPPSPTMSRPSQLLQSMVSLVAQLSPNRPAAPSRSGSESSPHGPSSLHSPHQAAQHSPGATARHPARHSLLKSETQDRRRSLLRHTLGGLAPAVESLSRRPSPAGASPLAQSSLPLLEVQHASTGGVGLVAGAGRVARAGGAGAAAAAAFPPPSSPLTGAPSPHSSPDQYQLPQAVLAALQDGDRAQLQGCHRASLQSYHNAHVYGFLPSFLALLRLNAISQAQALLQAFSSFISHVCHTDPSHLCSCHQAMCLTRKLGAQWQLAAASVLQGLLHESGSEHLKSAAAAPAPSLTPRTLVAAASQQPSMVLVQEAAHMGGSPSCHAAPAKLSLETFTEVPHSATAGVEQEVGELLRAAQHQLALACQTLAFLSYTLHAHNSTLAPALRQHQRHQQDTRGLRERLPQQQASQWSPPAAKQPSGEVGSGPKSGGYLALPSCHAVRKGSVIGLPIPIVWHSMLPMVDGANAAADDDASGLVTAVLQPPSSQAGAGPLPGLLPPSLAPPSPDPPTSQQTYPCRLRLCHAAFDVSHLSAVAEAAAFDQHRSHGGLQVSSPAAKAVRLLIQPSYATGLLVLAHACDDAVQHYLRTCRPASSPAAAAQCRQRHAQGSSAAPASPTSIHDRRGSGGGDVEPVGASQQQEGARGLTRVNWTLLHHYPGAARSAALWKELGDWRKAVLLAFTLHRLLQTSHAAQTSSSPSAAHPPATPLQAAGKGVVSAVVTANGSSSSRKQGDTACPPLPSTCSTKPAVSAWACASPGTSPAAPLDLNLDPHTCTPTPAPATSPAALLAPGPSTPQHQPWAGSRMISAMASGKAKRPPAAPPPGSCLEIGWSILEDQMGPGLEAMELQAACRTLHELVAIPLHALGQQSEVYLCLLKKVATRLMDLLPKRVCITPLLPSPCPAPSALLAFSLSSIRTHLQCHLAQLMAQAHAQLKLAHSCSLDSRVSLKEVLQAMLGGAETRAVIKLLLLWAGAFSAECCEQALEQLLASSSHHELLDPFSWTAANLLPSLHSALTQSALLPPHDTACVLSAAAQLIQAAEAGGHPDFPRRSVGQRNNWGRSSAAGACVGPAAEPAHSPGASKPGRPAATGPSDSFPSLINLNELSLVVEVTQLMGTLLQCLQPHVASALHLLPQAHGSLLLGSIPAAAAAQESAAGQDQDGVLEGGPPPVSCLPPTAVADHLQALAALDWALVCRAHVASLLHHLQLRCTQSQDAMPVDACQWLASIPAVQPLLPALPAAMELPSSAVAPPSPPAKDVDAAAKPTKEQPSHSQSNLRDLSQARGEPVRGCVLGPELNARCTALSTITISELVAGAQAKDTSCSTNTSSPGTSAHCCVHLSPSRRFTPPSACCSIAQQDADAPGNKLGTGSLPDLELLLLQWAIALVFADTYHPETELQATVLHVLSQLQGQALDPALVTEMSTALRERAVYNGRLAEQIRRLLAAAHTSQPAAEDNVSSNEGAAARSTSAVAGAATAVPGPPGRQPCVRVGNRVVRGPEQTAMEVGRACLTALHQYASASSTPPSLQPCGPRAGSVTQQPSKAGNRDSCCVSVLCCALHMLQANPGQFRQTTPCDVPGVLAQLSLCFANPFRPCLAVKGTGSSLIPLQRASDQLQATAAVINALQGHCPQPQAFDVMIGTQHPPVGPCHQEQHCQQTTAPGGQQQQHHHVEKQGMAGDMQQQEGVAASTEQELWALLSLGSWRLVGAADWAWGLLRPCPQPQLAVQLSMPDVPCTGSPCRPPPPPAALQQADQPDQPSQPDKLDQLADPPDHSVEPRLGCPVEDKLGSMASLRGHDGYGLTSVNSSACHSPNSQVMSPLPLPPSLSALQPGATRPSYLHHHLLRQQARASGSRHAGKPRPAPLETPPSQLSPPASPRCDSASSPSDSPSTWAGSDPPDTESGAGSRAALQCKITAAGADSCACQGLQPGSLAQPHPGSDPASPLQTCASSAELELDSCRVLSGPCRLSASGTSAVTDDAISSLLDKAAGQGPGVRGMGSGSLLLGADHTDRQTSQHTHPCHPDSTPAVADASQAGQGHYSALNAVAKINGLSQLPLGQQNSSAADHPPAVRLQSRPATGKADVMLQAVNQAALAAAHLAAAAGQKARAASAFVRSTGLPMLGTASSSRAAAVPSPSSSPARAAAAKLSSGHPRSRPQSPISAVLHPPSHQPGAQEGVTACHAACSGQASAGAAPGRGLNVIVHGAQRGIGSSPKYAMERYSQEPVRNTQTRLSGRRHSSRLAAPDKGWGHDALTRTASLFAARPAWTPSSPAAGRFHTAAAAEAAAGGGAHGSAHPDNRRQGSVRVRLADFLHGSTGSRALQQAALSTAAPGSPTARSASRALRRSLEAGATALLHPATPPTLPAPHPLLGRLSSHDPFAAPGPQSWAPAFDSTTHAHPDSVAARMQGYAGAEAASLRSTFPRSSSATSSINPLYEALRHTRSHREQ